MSEQLRRNPNTRPRLLSGYIIAQGGGGCQAFGGEKFGKMKKFFGGGWGGGEVGVGRGDRTKQSGTINLTTFDHFDNTRPVFATKLKCTLTP